METMIKIEDVFRPARQTTPGGKQADFFLLGSSHISMRSGFAKREKFALLQLMRF
jgi:hypothetical protein